MPLRFINKNILQVPADIIVSPSDGMNFTENNISKAIYDKYKLSITNQKYSARQKYRRYQGNTRTSTAAVL